MWQQVSVLVTATGHGNQVHAGPASLVRGGRVTLHLSTRQSLTDIMITICGMWERTVPVKRTPDRNSLTLLVDGILKSYNRPEAVRLCTAPAASQGCLRITCS